MKALFVTNQHKTGFYEVLAQELRRRGVDISWISVSTRWTEYLLQHGWPRDKILSLPDFGAEWSGSFTPSGDDLDRVKRIEARGETSLNNILIMDRELNKRHGLETPAYVYVATREIERFIRQHDVRVGFGEPTWAPEMLTSEVLRANGGRYFMHHTVRIPSGRIGFFEGIFHDKIAHIAEPTEEHRQLAREAIARLREKGERPYYFTRNMNPQRFRPHWVDEAMTAALNSTVHRYDHTVPSLLTRSRRRLKKRVYANAALRAGDFEEPDLSSPASFVLVTLHVQPESSVDVFGNAKNNQLETIRALTRLLPFGLEIWVKEHGHALGDRAPSYYEELRHLPGLRLIRPSADTMALIRKARLVVSVAGTSSLEAAVMGIPAATFGRLVWDPILVANDLDPFGMSHRDMAALLDKADVWRRALLKNTLIEDFVTSLVAQSFEGLVSDPISDPSCVEAGNIDKVATGTISLIRAANARGPT